MMLKDMAELVSQLRDFEWPAGWMPHWEGLDRWAAGNPIVPHAELVAEVGPGHILYDHAVKGILVADRQGGSDDYIFFFPQGSAPLAMVHLTWTGKRDLHAEFPSTELIQSIEELRQFLINNPNGI